MKKNIKNFLLINVSGDIDYIAAKFDSKFIIKKLLKKENKNDLLVTNLLKFVKKNKIAMTKDMSILVNLGPGSYSSLRIALSVAKGISIAKGSKIYGFKKKDLKEITLKNVEKLIKKNLLENKLIKPIYLS
tara:strand:+ start:1037 stop:1429 length:393 start_codon:yes stop_codon:yes gene_type:complete